MFYLKYNGIDLTQLVKVRDVSLPSLPEIEHNSVDIWEMDGNVFSSLSYGNKTIELALIIQPLNPDDLDLYVNDVKRVFFTREPQPLYVGDETRYILAVPEGEISTVELGKGTCEITVTLIAYSPYWISKEVQVAELGTGNGTVENNGDVPTFPVISVGVGGDTTFIQIENEENGERILIGDLPKTGKETVKANTYILRDNCESTAGWTQSSASIDTGCSTGGTLTVTEDGGGICIGEFGNGNGTWKGACYRKNLDRAVKDFKVGVSFEFNSTGKHGDPTVTEKIKEDMTTSIGGTITYHYEVNVQVSLTIRSGPGDRYKKLGAYKKGHKIESGTVVGGWLKHYYDGKTAYVKTKYLKKIATDNRYTTGACNFVVNKSTALRSSATKYSTSKATIPAGTVVRCSIQEYQKFEKDGGSFRKLLKAYKGKTGYIDVSDVTQASDVVIEYEEEGERADDKQGICQVYGFSSNGVQLFSLTMIDDSEWYESAHPIIKKDGVEFLTDSAYNLPEPKKEKVFSNSTITYETISSGRYGRWNEFYGNLYIERINNTWYAWAGRSGKVTIKTPYTYNDINANEHLSYMVIYIGTSDPEKPAGMAINEIRVQTATDITPATQNIQRFEEGDIIEIDCGIPSVKLNDVERNDLVDIGSQFFSLQVGENSIKSASDAELNLSVLYNEKFL